MEKASQKEAASQSLPPTSPVIPANVKPEQVDRPKHAIMRRPGFGTSGRHISLLTNCFKVLIKRPDETFYQYSV